MAEDQEPEGGEHRARTQRSQGFYPVGDAAWRRGGGAGARLPLALIQSQPCREIFGFVAGSAYRETFKGGPNLIDVTRVVSPSSAWADITRRGCPVVQKDCV